MSTLDFIYPGSASIVAIGGGVTTDTIIRTMRRPYFGAIPCIGFTPEQIPAGDGPTRFVQCQRARLTGPCRDATAGAVVRHSWEARNAVTYEAGLRWMLTDPNLAVKHGRIAVLSDDPIIKDGEPCVLVFGSGGDSPRISLERVPLDEAWPKEWDLLWALKVEPFPSAAG